MSASNLFYGQLVALWAAAPQAGVEAEDAQTRFYTRTSISPGGDWVLVLVEEHQPFVPPGAPPGTRATRAVGQWVFRAHLAAGGAVAQLLHRREGKEVAEDGNSYETEVVLDDSTTLAIGVPVLTRWDASGKRSEKKLAEIGRGFAKLNLHPLGKSALLTFHPLEGEKYKEMQLVLDTKSLQLSRAPSLAGVLGHDVHWTGDGKHLFFMEAAPGKSGRDGVRFEDESYRLVRMELKSAKRQLVSDRVWSDGICFGKDAIVWNYEGGGRKGKLFKTKVAPPHNPTELPSLKEWEPVVSLGGERFLFRTFDWKRHRIVDLAAFDQKTFESDSIDLNLPKYRSSNGILYSPAMARFVVSTEPFTLVLTDEAGTVLEKVQLNRESQPGKASR